MSFGRSTLSERGFTLIELMIAITLGLLITAAVTRVLVTSSSSMATQQAGSDAVNDEVFGLSPLLFSARMSNYGAGKASSGPDLQDEFYISDTTPFGGVALTSVTSAVSLVTDLNIMSVDLANLVSKGAERPSNLSGTKSDVLTLQRKTENATIDCQGNNVPADRYLLETYFLREDSNTVRSGEPTPLALACLASNYATAAPFAAASVAPSSLNTAGEVLIGRTDYFGVLLGVNESLKASVFPEDNEIRYYTIAQYKALAAPRPRIVALKLGLVVRSTNPVNTGPTSAEQRFNVLNLSDASVAAAEAAKGRYNRRVIEKTIILRNGRA